jgi:hypothetical protein
MRAPVPAPNLLGCRRKARSSNVAGVPLEPATEDALNSIAAEMKIGRSELIQIVLREWLEANAYLPVRTIDEESETGGSA